MVAAGLVLATRLVGGWGATAASVAEVDPNNWLRQCAPPFKRDAFHTPYVNYSNYELIGKAAGLCADHLSCAFEECAWTAEAQEALTKADLATADMRDLEKSLPPLNLPAAIAFPTGVKDVADALAYAREHHMTVSVKTSGHSYAGSSSQRGSLNLNLRALPKYSRTSIVTCAGAADSGNACKLAKARGKTGVVRVGGGELWDDLYRAVLAHNTASGHSGATARKYTVVGGGAGTVSAAGGWMHGGGLSIGLERRYGLGADQTLELEMVLADGRHVKFGPTAWEAAKGFLFPKTTNVTGLCNQNVDNDESKWRWEACDTPVPFDDLWLAVRGGGGGTYGLLTALHYQLHDYTPLVGVTANATASGAVAAQCTKVGCDITAFAYLFYDFLVDLLFNPSALGLSEEVSHSCGSPGSSFSLTGTLGGSYFNGVYCWESATATSVVQAWQAYSRAVVLPAFPDLAPVQNDLHLFLDTSYQGSYAEMMLASHDPRVPAGHVPDNPAPATFPDNLNLCWSALVPAAWLVQKNAEVHYFLDKVLTASHLTGGAAAQAHDQMTAVPAAEREAGFQTCIFDVPGAALQSHYRAQFAPFYPKEPDAGAFPGGTEYNHIAANVIGPLKADWTAPCPMNYTKAQQAKDCVSLQESVWGTALLAKLEAVKHAVDPEHLFNCFRCVGEQ